MRSRDISFYSLVLAVGPATFAVMIETGINLPSRLPDVRGKQVGEEVRKSEKRKVQQNNSSGEN